MENCVMQDRFKPGLVVHAPPLSACIAVPVRRRKNLGDEAAEVGRIQIWDALKNQEYTALLRESPDSGPRRGNSIPRSPLGERRAISVLEENLVVGPSQRRCVPCT